MMQAKAWELEIGSGICIAVAACHMTEFIPIPQVVVLPLAPEYAAGLMVWRGGIIPVMDFGRIRGGVAGRSGEETGAVILAYQRRAGAAISYGAQLVAVAPKENWVRDDMACTLPAEHSGMWEILALSCYQRDGQTIPVLDVSRMFSALPAQERGNGSAVLPEIPQRGDLQREERGTAHPSEAVSGHHSGMYLRRNDGLDLSGQR